MSLSYVTKIVEGCIFCTEFVAIAMGTDIVILDSESLRSFIQVANRFGVYKVLEDSPSNIREALVLIYEEFGDQT